MQTIIQQINYQDCQAIIILNHGKNNSVTLQMVRELGEALDEVRKDPNVTVVVIESINEKFFSIGFDIPSLIELPREEFQRFYSLFNRFCLKLYTFPKPIIAMVTGHAIAGGCILALCCDIRYMSEGHNLIGLNEVKLGVPVPYPADCILRDSIGSRKAREIVERGLFYLPPDACKLGLVDRVLPEDEIRQEVDTHAHDLGSLPPNAFWAIKKNRVERVATQILAKLEEKEGKFVELWYSEEARQKLKEALEKY